MSLNPHALRPVELVRLLNATPLGATVSRGLIFRQRDQAGVSLGDGQAIDLIRYVAWLFLEWRERSKGGPGCP